MIKTRKPMSLAVAAWKDMVMMIMQDHDYEAFYQPNCKGDWPRVKSKAMPRASKEK